MALTQRPDLFAGVVCSAPLLDMVRYEKFGLGSTWNVEYGSADVPEELEWLLAYSPYHHVREGVDYPATLFTVFDGDSRVDPLHARKLCAALQHATSGARPVLIRAEGDVGHGARALSRSVTLFGRHLAFSADCAGLRLPAAASRRELSVQSWPHWVKTLLDVPLKIALILVVAIVVRVVVHRVVDRIAESIATGRAGLGRLDERLPSATAILSSSSLLSVRARAAGPDDGLGAEERHDRRRRGGRSAHRVAAARYQHRCRCWRARASSGSRSASAPRPWSRTSSPGCS